MLNLFGGINRDEKRFEHLIKNSFDMIALLDENATQLYVSESCERILGYKTTELTPTQVIEEFIHPKDIDAVRKGFQDILSNKGFGSAQYRHKHKDGGWVYLEANGSNQLHNPLINAIILNVRDITESKKAERALRKSEKALKELNATKDRFFSIISHDLRTPFAGILGISDLLLELSEEGSYEEFPELVSHIKDSAQQAFSLLENLLEWSRTQTGRLTFNPENFTLNHSIQDIVLLLNDAAREKSISIISQLPRVFQVNADKHMVDTILRNLISNSIKFTKPGGEISISVTSENDKINVSVKDTGIGIPAKRLRKLFNVEGTRSTCGTKHERGTGLGLLLCKEFVDMHGESIWAESEPGVGSTISFSLSSPLSNTAHATRKKLSPYNI